MPVDERTVSAAKARARSRASTAVDHVAVWEESGADLVGIDRVLLFSAWMTSQCRSSVRDARRVEVVAVDSGRALVRAPEENPFVDEVDGVLAPAWAEAEWLVCRRDEGADPGPFVELYARRRDLAAAEVGALVAEITTALERDLGPIRGWTVLSEVVVPRFAAAYCCGYDARIFSGNGASVLLAPGLVCG